MKEFFFTAQDGAKIAYSVTGEGDALLCVHGSGRSKEYWQECGWVDVLKTRYTVITPDLRGFGHSSVYHDAEHYAIDRILGDLRGVLKDCGAENARYFGHSYGATIGFEALAAGLPLTRAVLASGSPSAHFFREVCPAEAAEYRTLAAAKRTGLDALREKYSPEEIEFIQSEDMDKFAALFEAWSGWPVAAPEAFGGRTALYTGTKDFNTDAIDLIARESARLAACGISARLFEGLNHGELLTRRDLVQPWVLEQLQ